MVHEVLGVKRSKERKNSGDHPRLMHLPESAIIERGLFDLTHLTLLVYSLTRLVYWKLFTSS